MLSSVVPLLVLLARVAAAPLDGSVEGTVRASGTRAPVAGAVVSIPALGRRARSDAVGHFRLRDVPAGEWQVHAAAAGHLPYVVIVRVPAVGAVRLDIELDVRVTTLGAVEVKATRDTNIAQRTARALFDREVLPGVSSISRREVQDLPTIVEPDVLRALQAMPGVTAPSELDAQLYVRGGGPDQSLFLLDGARVFGPHHLFGMSGVFNADAVERVELFRGVVPARFGSALSAVVDIGHDTRGDGRTFEGGLSMLGARGTVRGSVAGQRADWMLSGRRTHVDLARGDAMPYAFHDVQGGFAIRPDPQHRIVGSVLTTTDRFRMFSDAVDRNIASQWGNTVGSLGWSWTGARGWSTSSVLWGSRYTASLGTGEAATSLPTTNHVMAAGLRLDAIRERSGGSLRIGADLEGGRIGLEGTAEHGGFFFGSVQRGYAIPAIYAEAEQRIGRLRLVPGLRMVYDARLATVQAEPRLGARLAISERTALTLGLARAHQAVSMLRDERTVIPGASFWFVHPEDAPASRTDGASLEMDNWLGGGWAVRTGVFARRFEDTPHWRPVAVRDLETLSYDDGSAVGAELQLRRYGDRTSGWIGYTASRVQFTDAASGASYRAPWDRQHSVNAALMVRPYRRVQLAMRAEYGSGRPFWPFAGDALIPGLEPLLGRLESAREVPLWGTEQLRMPSYVRVDAGIKSAFDVGKVQLEPYLNLQNVGMRPNVLYYSLTAPPESARTPDTVATLHPEGMPGFLLPTLGFNVRF